MCWGEWVTVAEYTHLERFHFWAPLGVLATVTAPPPPPRPMFLLDITLQLRCLVLGGAFLANLAWWEVRGESARELVPATV